MNPNLKEIVYNRLLTTGALDHSWSTLIMAACESPEELTEALGEPRTRPGPER